MFDRKLSTILTFPWLLFQRERFHILFLFFTFLKKTWPHTHTYTHKHAHKDRHILLAINLFTFWVWFLWHRKKKNEPFIFFLHVKFIAIEHYYFQFTWAQNELWRKRNFMFVYWTVAMKTVKLNPLAFSNHFKKLTEKIDNISNQSFVVYLALLIYGYLTIENVTRNVKKNTNICFIFPHFSCKKIFQRGRKANPFQ